MDKVIKIKKIVGNQSFCGTRALGELVRVEIQKALDSGHTVVLDFEGISGITQGFGDEIVGIFVRAYGPEFVKKRFKFENYNEKVKGIINAVYSYSKKTFQVHSETSAGELKLP